MRLFARILREPLVHFLVIGMAVFGVYSFVTRDAQAPRERIVVSEGRLRQLAEIYARTWQRPPTPEELRGLIDGYVEEEVYYREAVKLGLDLDDTVVRRRMQQKMEFLTEPSEELLQASDAELAGFLVANRDSFRVEPRIAFQQVFINPAKDGPPAVQRASATLEDLRSAQAAQDARRRGDPTLLPYDMPLSPLPVIARSFGDDFAGHLSGLPQGEWSGPVPSPFGLHIVRITALRSGYDPPLAEVREAVLSEWQHRKRDSFTQESFRRLLDRYEVILPADGTTEAVAK